MKLKRKGALVLGLVLVAMVAAFYVLPASAAMNGDTDQTQDRLRDKTHGGDCGCDCLQDVTQARTRLQIRDCLCIP